MIVIIDLFGAYDRLFETAAYRSAKQEDPKGKESNPLGLLSLASKLLLPTEESLLEIIVVLVIVRNMGLCQGYV